MSFRIFVALTQLSDIEYVVEKLPYWSWSLSERIFIHY